MYYLLLETLRGKKEWIESSDPTIFRAVEGKHIFICQKEYKVIKIIKETRIKTCS